MTFGKLIYCNGSLHLVNGDNSDLEIFSDCNLEILCELLKKPNPQSKVPQNFSIQGMRVNVCGRYTFTIRNVTVVLSLVQVFALVSAIKTRYPFYSVRGAVS